MNKITAKATVSHLPPGAYTPIPVGEKSCMSVVLKVMAMLVVSSLIVAASILVLPAVVVVVTHLIGAALTVAAGFLVIVAIVALVCFINTKMKNRSKFALSLADAKILNDPSHPDHGITKLTWYNTLRFNKFWECGPEAFEGQSLTDFICRFVCTHQGRVDFLKFYDDLDPVESVLALDLTRFIPTLVDIEEDKVVSQLEALVKDLFINKQLPQLFEQFDISNILIFTDLRADLFLQLLHKILKTPKLAGNSIEEILTVISSQISRHPSDDALKRELSEVKYALRIFQREKASMQTIMEPEEVLAKILQLHKDEKPIVAYLFINHFKAELSEYWKDNISSYSRENFKILQGMFL